MYWDELFADFAALWPTRRWGQEQHRLRGAATRLFARASWPERQWLTGALEDDERKWFAAFVIDCAGDMPRRFFGPMLRAAVYERNPSNNRTFVEPCLRRQGVGAVVEALLAYVSEGSDFEKAGAVNALYWAWRPEHATARGTGQAANDLSDLAGRQNAVLLTEFVRNANVDVRRSIISKLPLDPNNYPAQLRGMVGEAVRIAETSPDDYVRHRLAIQLGAGGPFEPLPHRGEQP